MNRQQWLLMAMGLCLVLFCWALHVHLIASAREKVDGARQSLAETRRMASSVLAARQGGTTTPQDLLQVLRATLRESGITNDSIRSVEHRQTNDKRPRILVRLGPFDAKQLSLWSAAWYHANPSWIIEECSIMPANANSGRESTLDIQLTLIEHNL